MKISQVSLLSGRAQGLLERMLQIAPILQMAEFKLDSSTHYMIKDSDSFSGSAARAEGSPVQADNQVPTASSVSLALYSREVTLDDVRKLDKNVGLSEAGLRLFSDRRLAGLAVKLATEIQDDMLSGSAANNKMLGILNFVKDAEAAGQTERLGFSAAELAAMNQRVSLKLDSTANQDAFIEVLYKALAEVPGANAILCNINLSARLNTIAKRLGAAGETINSFGTRVQTFNNVPIVPLPTTAMPQTESDGANADNCSLVIARFSEELGTAFSTNSGFYFQDFPDVQAAAQAKARLQFFLNLEVERTDALKRLSRIRL